MAFSNFNAKFWTRRLMEENSICTSLSEDEIEEIIKALKEIKSDDEECPYCGCAI